MKSNIERLSKRLMLSDYDALLTSLNHTALVSMTDALGNITYVNQKFVDVSKYSHDELLGQNHRILKSGHQPDSLFDDLWATISSGKVWRGEINNRAKDGTYYWVDTSIAPIIGSSGKPERYISVRFLITDKKEREKEVEAAKAKDEAILISIGEGLLGVDKNGRVFLMNRTAEEILGCKPEDFLDKKIEDALMVRDEKGVVVPKSKRPFFKVLATKKTVIAPSSFYYTRKDGEVFPVSISVAPIMLGNDIIGAIDVFRDITHEKQVDKVKTEFVSLASHQLRTPPTAIKWNIDLLKVRSDNLTVNQLKLMGQIEKANEKMIHLVEAMLNASRMELGTFYVTPKQLSLGDIAKNSVSEFKKVISEKGLKIKKTIASDLPKYKADKDLVEIVFQNMISNAVKYTPEDGRIEVAISHDKNKFQIKISDTGYGIPESQHERVFTKLFRADNIRNMVVDGTGLGLYLVKSIIDFAGGKIWFESKENAGTTFYIELPDAGMTKKEGTTAFIKEVE